ncbi:uncharacterized protein LOC124805775 [Hydra vulgaris]|uniref:uncharacterized protein LOC124805775 n=1 Tax=Hydra vulgaris TaxID=6087 RepID=UPI001F5E74D6|nr:uncharacterized protein LOC124805775 [Hydra vulgaris]XP_047123708.1 uncharacterized protein LOC124805775 [Hydra vulgaris]
MMLIFKMLRQTLNCKIMIQVYINVLVSTEPNKSNFPTKFIAELCFKSHLGIDKSFLEKLNNCIKSHATSSKANEDSFQPYLVDINNQLHELKTANIFEYKCFCILLRKSKRYSLFTIDDVELNFTWASGLNEKETRYFNIWNGISTSDQLTKNIEACEEIDDFEKKVDVTVTSLKYLRRLLEPDNCYCESTRRLILNILLLSALRVGNGPFDYFVIGKKQAFIALVLDKLVESSDLSNQNEDEILPAPTVIKAKTDIDVCELPNALGHLIAQMIDTLNIVSSRKRSHDTMLCGSSHALEMVKGMLSTGHHNLFFSLTQGNSSESKPVLNYYGKHFINILKRKPGRNSGLEQFEEIKKSEIEHILRAIFCFVTHEY